jgi:hypothetical protein
MPVQIYESLDDLPAIYQELFDEAGRRDFFLSREWFENLIGTTTIPQERPRLYGLEDQSGTAQGLLITRSKNARWMGFLPKRSLESCTSMYSVSFAPVCRGGPYQRLDIAEPLVRAIVGDQIWDTIQFDCWDPRPLLFEAFVTALRRHGFLVQTFSHFGNWYEDVRGLSFDAYMDRRPSRLRNTLLRKQKKLATMEDVRFDIICGPNGLEAGIQAYEDVYAASWKPPEPYPNFAPGLMRSAAKAGALRLGILWVGDKPIAAQIWIVAGGCATIFKLAHRESWKPFSPGSLLMANMIRREMASDACAEIDGGRGDDLFKESWLSQRRERMGLVAVNRKTYLGSLISMRRFAEGAGRALLKAIPGRAFAAQRLPSPSAFSPAGYGRSNVLSSLPTNSFGSQVPAL